MVELKIQNSTDREKLVTALANSGYAVRVVTQTQNGKIGTEYFVQILDAENTQPQQHYSIPIVSVKGEVDPKQLDYIWQGISKATFSNLV